jgi:PadR family transcriptional regulator, regulatory protein AphA
MTLELAILGLLSLHPLTGYDIKKIFADSTLLYWSGSNNQIYHTLVALHRKNLVTREIQLQEEHPSRKLYTITHQGLAELKKWIQGTPELPQLRHPFLIQLAWADLLSPAELETLLVQYEEEVQMQLHLLQPSAQMDNPALKRKNRQDYVNPAQARTPREKILWDMLLQNRRSFYENELKWIKELRSHLSASLRLHPPPMLIAC